MAFRAMAVLGTMAMLMCLSGAVCGGGDSSTLFMPPGDNTAICQTISPGSEIAARVGFRGRALKLQWSANDLKLEKSGTVETLTLVATAPSDGYVSGDTNGKFKLIVSREGGLAIDEKYRDSPLRTGQQAEHFDVAISSDPSVQGLPLMSGSGTAKVSEYSRNMNHVTIRVSFMGSVLNLVTSTQTSTQEELCGEAFYDGPVQLKGF